MTDAGRAQGALEMTTEDVLAFLDLAAGLGVKVWIDGGWAVDACLGRQTRKHADLDLALPSPDMNALARELRARGYSTAPRNDNRSTNFALGDAAGHEVDLHSAELYPPGSLAGNGEIGGHNVDCVPPDWLVRFHSGYPLDETDRADVLALCAAFGIELPDEYR
jgi:lincosamide nucleotidyltransferase A/C/D/E